jgi:hypothetical protein
MHPSLNESLLNQYASNTEIYSVSYRQQQQGGNLETTLKGLYYLLLRIILLFIITDYYRLLFISY